ncbi:MAG: 3-oxoacyl-ACP synthase [Spirochaetia bacterium]
MHVGIVGHGVWLPSTFMSSEEIARATGIPEDVVATRFGVKRKPVAGPGVTTAGMGLAAAKRALENAGIPGSQVDLVIWCGGQHKDYPCWLAGLYVAEHLEARGAWSFDMEAMCGSMMAALDIARSLIIAREDLETVLIVSGYRNNDLIDLKEPATRFMLDIGSGASALVLRKNAGRNAVLASAFRGDGSFSEMCVVPTLGTRAWPPAPGDESRAHFIVPNEDAFKKKLNELTLPNFYAVIREALQRSHLGGQGIDYLAILHFKRSAHDAVLKELGLGPANTTYLDEYGHLGQNDQVLSLELGLAAGKVRDGSTVVFVGAGLGFVWAATVIKWGPFKE